MTGIDYGGGLTNVDHETGIRYGVISMHEVTQAWCDTSEGYYGEPDEAECKSCGHSVWIPGMEWGDIVDCDECGESCEIDLPDGAEPLSHRYESDGYAASQGSDGDIFILKSPFYTLCEYCSPCAPGAGYLMNRGNVKAYCFGHDWFDGGKAPYPVFRVETGEPVLE